MAPATAPLRLLFVSIHYYPYMGGIERHVFEVAHRLVAQGVDVSVLTTDGTGTLPPVAMDDGVRIRRVPAWPAERDYYIAPDILREIRPGRWDIVHLQGYHAAVAPLAMIASLRAGLPYVVTFHSGGHDSRLRQRLRPLQILALRPLLSRARRLVAVSDFEAAYFGRHLRLPARRFTVIPNGTDRPPERLPDASDPERPLLLSVGRLQRFKGHDRAIEALPSVLRRYPEARLRIAGAGPYEGALRRLARERGLAERVEIAAVPAGDREAMAELLSRASLVVSMSEYEAHPIACLEAIAAGRPLLVAGTSGLQELADRGLAHAIPSRSTPIEIGDAIVGALSERPMPVTLDLPTWDDCAARLHALYDEVLGGTRCAS